jgi:hypothetical protein
MRWPLLLAFAAAVLSAACSGGPTIGNGFDALFGFPKGTSDAIHGSPPSYDDDAFTPEARACGVCAASACKAESTACVNDRNCACTMPCRSGGGTAASCSATCGGAPDDAFAAENACLLAHCAGCGVAT